VSGEDQVEERPPGEYYEGRPPVTIVSTPGEPPASFNSVYRPILRSGGHGSVPQLVGNWEHFKGAIVSVGLQRTGERQIRVLGTAVMVAPGVALTATHVLTDDLEALMAGSATIKCFGVRSATAMDVWRVTSFIRRNLDDDLTVLSLRPTSGARKAGLPRRSP
jgi:hypothetical protein